MVLGSESNTKTCKRVADFDLNVEAAPAKDHHESQENRSENVSLCRIKDDRRTCVTLQCRHKFHLDCIAKEFNEKKEMKCPNCGHIEQSRWFNPNPNPEIGSSRIGEGELDGLCSFIEKHSDPISPFEASCNEYLMSEFQKTMPSGSSPHTPQGQSNQESNSSSPVPHIEEMLVQPDLHGQSNHESNSSSPAHHIEKMLVQPNPHAQSNQESNSSSPAHHIEKMLVQPNPHAQSNQESNSSAPAHHIEEMLVHADPHGQSNQESNSSTPAHRIKEMLVQPNPHSQMNQESNSCTPAHHIEEILVQPDQSHIPWLHPDRINNSIWFGDEDTIRESISKMVRGLKIPYPTYSAMPKEDREMWFHSFAQEFNWDPSITSLVRKNFHKVASYHFARNMYKWKRTWRVRGEKPNELDGDLWNAYQQYWALPEVAKRSKINFKNRKNNRNGKGIATHNTSSKQLVGRQKKRRMDWFTQRSEVDSTNPSEVNKEAIKSSREEIDKMVFKKPPVTRDTNFGLGSPTLSTRAFASTYPVMNPVVATSFDEKTEEIARLRREINHMGEFIKTQYPNYQPPPPPSS